jgi:hypothetical protein
LRKLHPLSCHLFFLLGLSSSHSSAPRLHLLSALPPVRRLQAQNRSALFVNNQINQSIASLNQKKSNYLSQSSTGESFNHLLLSPSYPDSSIATSSFVWLTATPRLLPASNSSIPCLN